MFDILVKNGTIIDGTGKERYEGDVAIKDGAIVAIGHLHNERAEIEVDAQGKYVCPGFIDVNNHSDTYWQIFLNPNLESLLYQGITTIIGGNCGSSLAPLASAKNIETIQKWADFKAINLNWLSLDDFFKEVEKLKLPVNFATMTGHATLRRGVLRDESRGLTYKETAYVKKSLTEALKSGSLGMSTGLIYTHARMATTEELVDLAKIIKGYGGVYASHVRGEKEDLIEAIQEAIEIGERAGVKVHISHLKAMGEKNWPKMKEALGLIEKAHATGLDITFDVYPYTNTGSVLYAMLPSWIAEGGKRMMLHRLKDKSIRKKVIQEMKKSGFDYDKVEIAISPLNKTLARKKITEIAKSQEKTIEDAIIDILIASEGRVISSMEVLSENNVQKAIIHPLSIISSNASGYSIGHRDSGELVHPRSFGTFPRVLKKYVSEKKILTWESAIHKMTWAAAKKFGIPKRGKIEKNYMADVIIIDPEKIDGPANRENPYQYSRGIDWMAVNGKVVLENGKFIGQKPGQIVKR